MNQNIFRAYDIRGIYGKDLTEEFAEKFGKAFGTFIGTNKKIVVGRDTRANGESLKNKLIDGLTSVGCSVVDIGVASTPLTYFAILHNKFDGGVVVTASHNTAEWNGFIPINDKGFICSEGFGMEKIKEIFFNESFTKNATKGSVSKLDVVNDYTKFVLGKVHINKKFKVVLDVCGGSTAHFAPLVFSKAGCEVVTINDRVDGRFFGRKPDVTEELLAELKNAVIKNKADLGLAFDADGDRTAFVDNQGRYCGSGNTTIAIFSDYYLRSNPNAKIVFDVCCSSFIEEFVKAKGGIPLLNRVGHSFIVNRMIQENAIFGGEYSNHLYFSEFFGSDDAIFAGLKLLEIMSADNKTLAELIDSIPKYPATNVESLSCLDLIKFGVVESLKKKISSMGYKIIDLDGVKALGPEGWFLIRASNTNPAIKINAEGKTQEAAQKLHKFATEIVLKEINNYGN